MTLFVRLVQNGYDLKQIFERTSWYIIPPDARMLVGGGIFDCTFNQHVNFLWQEDSTVYFYEATLDTFQVLYDFSAKKGDQWLTLFDMMGETDTLQVTVDSIWTEIIHDDTLITQLVRYSGLGDDHWDQGYNSKVQERLGDHYYMFNLMSLQMQ